MESLARNLIETLNQLEISYVVLHGADRIDAGLTGDLDIAVGADQYVVLGSLLKHLRGFCAPVLLWPSSRVDLGSVWLSCDWSESVQLDLTRDRLGRGRYGLLTDRALNSRIWSGSCWVLPVELETAYLISKRWAKGDVRAVKELHERGVLERQAEIMAYFSARAVARIQRASQGQSPRRVTDPWYIRERLSVRGLKRLLEPEGMRQVVGGLSREQIADFFRDFPTLLPYVRFHKKLLTRTSSSLYPAVAPLITLEYWDPSKGAESQLIDEWAKVVRLLSAKAEDRIRKRSVIND